MMLHAGAAGTPDSCRPGGTRLSHVRKALCTPTCLATFPPQSVVTALFLVLVVEVMIQGRGDSNGRGKAILGREAFPNAGALWGSVFCSSALHARVSRQTARFHPIVRRLHTFHCSSLRPSEPVHHPHEPQAAD